jgi:putative aldouronate transport system permease protein
MSAAQRPAWMGEPTLAGRFAKTIVLTIVTFLVVYPFITIIATSLGSEREITRSGGLILFWPSEPTLDAYRTILAGGVVARALWVSTGITIVGTLMSLTATVCMAYALSRPMFGRSFVVRMTLFTLFFAPGIIPNYLVVRELGLLNSYGALIFPVLINAFNLLVMRQFFMGIPGELIDAARIDGAGELQILFRVVLPLSKAVIAVIGLFYAVAYWNAFFNAVLYLSDSAKWPLQIVVRLYVLSGISLPGTVAANDASTPPPEAMQMAIVVVAILPILLAYPFLQRYFSRGVLTGAIKG